MAAQGPKPYVKLASSLAMLGMGLFMLEQYGLSRLEGPSHAMPLGDTVLTLLVVTPLALVAAGAIVFVVGRIRRL